MLTMVAAIALMPASYGITPTTKVNYDMTVALDGHLPIFGGTEGTASINLGLLVAGEKADPSGNPQASSDLTSVQVNFNGAPLPFDLASVRPYFPKTTISMNAQGHVLKTDAPDVQLPVRLPGLDVKRFPEISYLPVEFPDDGVEVGKTWTFKRPFGGNDVTYNVTATKIEGDTLTLVVKLDQAYETYEDDAEAIVASKDGAYAKVVTNLTGKGTVGFDLKRGLATSVQIEATAKSVVEVIKTGNKSDRSLKTTLTVKLKQPGKSRKATTPPTTDRYIGSWKLPIWASSSIDKAQQWAAGVALQLMATFMGSRKI